MSDETLQEILTHWKAHTFRPACDIIPLRDAAQALSKGEPLIEARPVNVRNRMMVYKGKRLATFSYAFVWQWGSPLETGNFIPQDELPPPNIALDKMTRFPSIAAVVTYIFDTKLDTGFQDNMKIIEKHLSDTEAFKALEVQRKLWQNHTTDIARSRYQATANLFIRRPKDLNPPDIPYRLHPWIAAIANSGRTAWYPNPSRPQYFEDAGDGKNVIDLEDAEQKKFNRGDIIWATFRLGIVIVASGWHTEMIPLEFVRVGRVPDGSYDIATWQTDPEYTFMTAERDSKGEGLPLKRKALSEPRGETSSTPTNHDAHKQVKIAVDIETVAHGEHDIDMEMDKENIDPSTGLSTMAGRVLTRSKGKGKAI